MFGGRKTRSNKGKKRGQYRTKRTHHSPKVRVSSNGSRRVVRRKIRSNRGKKRRSYRTRRLIGGECTRDPITGQFTMCPSIKYNSVSETAKKFNNDAKIVSKEKEETAKRRAKGDIQTALRLKIPFGDLQVSQDEITKYLEHVSENNGNKLSNKKLLETMPELWENRKRKFAKSAMLKTLRNSGEGYSTTSPNLDTIIDAYLEYIKDKGDKIIEGPTLLKEFPDLTKQRSKHAEKTKEIERPVLRTTGKKLK